MVVVVAAVSANLIAGRQGSLPVAEYRELRLDEIVEPPLPVRAGIEEAPLEDLAASIRLVGVLQPIIVVPDGMLHEIVAGHRRYLAAQRAGLDKVPCVIHPEKGIAKEAAMLHENIFREGLTAADEALFYAELIEKYDCTETALCQMVRQSVAYVNQRLELLRDGGGLFEAVRERKVSFSVARQLRRVKDERQRVFLLRQAIESDASERVVRQWVEQWKLDSLPTPPPAAEADLSRADSPSTDTGLRCFLCGGDKDPQNLRLLYVHWWEQAALEKMLREGGTP